ncbi:MAG TPA: CopG family transcriptional regulator [Terriglobia bacterium]|jgi:predicted DNA-binding protein
MKGITIKLPDETLRRLRRQAEASGRSIAALVRERVENPSGVGVQSVYAATSDLAGVSNGVKKPATNSRRKFRRK